jgi:glutathionyl-hydroquinone reductase
LEFFLTTGHSLSVREIPTPNQLKISSQEFTSLDSLTFHLLLTIVTMAHAQQQKAPYFPGTGRFDKINSTFRSKIILNRFNPKNKLPHMDGYSKGLLAEKEPDDKIYMLQCWIVRLYNCGYLDAKRATRIEFYEKSFLNNHDELFLVLEPTECEIVSEKYLLHDRLNKFLLRLYAAIKSKKPITKDLVDKKTVSTEENLFKVHVGKHSDIDDLRMWCIQRMKEGYEESQVKNYYYKYKARYL